MQAGTREGVALVLATTVRLQRCVAVRAHDPQILETVVVPDAVDVIQDERHAAALPLLTLTPLRRRRTPSGPVWIEVIRRYPGVRDQLVKRAVVSADWPEPESPQRLGQTPRVRHGVLYRFS